RSSALSARQPEALFDRVDADFLQRSARVVAGCRDVLPIGFMRDVTFLAVAGSGIKKVGRRRVVAEPEPLVCRCGKERYRFVLEDQTADRMKDWPAPVKLDAKRRVRAMADDDVGAGLDRRVRKGAHEFGRFAELALGLGTEQA